VTYDQGEPPFDPDYDRPTNGRRPPHDPQAERALLGALLLNPTAAPDIALELDPSDFYRPEHEAIWNAAHQLLADGTPLDAVTLAGHLTRTGQATKFTGGPLYLHTLIAECPNPASWPAYAKQIRDAARLRTIAETATSLNAAVDTGDLDKVDRVFSDAIATIDDAALRFGPRETGHTAWAPLDLERVLAGEEVDPPPALLARTDGAHMLYTGAVHTFSGEPGSGKTWVTLIAAVQQLALGHTVTMIDFEDRASRVVGRLLALGATPPQIRDHFRYLRPRTALDTTSRTDLDHATHGATLVILDGVTEAMTLHGLDLNANADVATFYDLLPRHIADTSGAAVTLIDHVVKDGEKQGRWALGGQHKLAGIDGVAYLVKAIEPFGRGKKGHARITVSKDRPGYVEEIALGRTVAELHLDATDVNILRHSLDAPAALPKDEAGNMRPTHLMERVSKYIEITPGLGKRDLLDGRISGKTTYLKRAIDRLVQEGYVEVAIGPNRQHVHRSVNPYREDEDAMHSNAGWADQETLP
jgi:hypothetical protein